MQSNYPYTYAAIKVEIAKRKKVQGIGVNDVPFPTKVIRDGRIVNCPIYDTWRQMLARTTQSIWEKAPHYKGTMVCDEWLHFSNFRNWVLSQNWIGNQLDKDIIDPFSKLYSPDTCRFVPRNVNVLLTERQNYRGELPLGVTLDKSQKSKQYQSQCSMEGITSKKN